jgi:molecular chaperone DnaK (HSP70)
MGAVRLGIDFGTTRTVVAAAGDGRYPVASFEVTDGHGDGYRDYLPGLAALAADGQWRFGWEAAAGFPDAIAGVRSIKRLVGQMAPDEPVVELRGELTALELTTRYLEHLARMIRERSNLEIEPDEPLEVAIAVPANATSRQRYLTIEAFGRAGFTVVGLVNEPTAAAIEFAYRNRNVLAPRSPKRYVIVYDLGGGTFDTSAVSLEGRRFALLNTEGIARLGGDDFDRLILDEALRGIGADADTLPDVTRAALLEACRAAKESLGPSSRRLMVDLGDLTADGEPVVLDAQLIYSRCEPLIHATVDLIDQVFAHLPEHAIDPDNPRELAGLYLVGGAVAFPPVGRILRSRYKRKIQLAPQPHAATAVGLAVFADPGAGIFVREAITRHFGVWREGDSGRDKIFDRILSKDTVPGAGEPIVVHRVYRPAHAVGHLRFLECARLDAAGQPAGDVTPWRELRFPYDPSLDGADLATLPVERRPQASSDEIAETYTYERDGTIAVAIENRTRGYRRSFVLGALR